MLVISFKDDNDEKVFHEVVNLLEQYEFQPTKEIKYQPVLTFIILWLIHRNYL